MNCEEYETSLLLRRPPHAAADLETTQHLSSCSPCSEEAIRIQSLDRRISSTLQDVVESEGLESRILESLRIARLQAPKPRFRFRQWFVIPALAALLAFAAYLGIARRPGARLNREIALLMSSPPAPEITSRDQQAIAEWCSRVFPGSLPLPKRLERVRFRAASSLEVASHRAVYLRMQNEQRASLLIVDGSLSTSGGGQTLGVSRFGFESRWSDEGKTYVLLFEGNKSDMLAYMQRMGFPT